MIDLLSLTRSQLTAQVVEWGYAADQAARLWRYLYVDLLHDVAKWRDLRASLRERLQHEAVFAAASLKRQTQSDAGDTRKYLLGLHDQRAIEAVLMRYASRTTACLSSQVGCALGCVFCATGQMGFERNLSAGEIVAQALYVLHESQLAWGNVQQTQPRLSNIVLMGMGEPLLNYDAVMRAVEIMQDSGGFAIGHRQITLSTVGVVPGIIRLADERRTLSLAVSLHLADQASRATIVPAARVWPLTELMEACRYYTTKMRRKIFFEWTLISGVSDSPEQARELVRLVKDCPAQINLIPLNPIAGYDAVPADAERLDRFRAVLADAGIPVSIRRRRGIEIDAGCGQLAAAN